VDEGRVVEREKAEGYEGDKEVRCPDFTERRALGAERCGF